MQINRTDLKNAMIKVLPFASTDPARPAVLQGVLFSLYNNELRIVAADGFKLACVTIPAESPDCFSIIIPALKLKDLAKIKTGKKEAGDIDLTWNQDEHSLTIDGKKYTSLDGTYPDYQQIIPRPQSAKIETVLPRDMGQAAKSMLVMAREGASITRWSITESGQVLSSHSEGCGSSRWDMPATTPLPLGTNFQIGLNAKFLKTLCDVTEGEPVTVRFSARNAPIRFDTASAVFVIMPMQLDLSYGTLVSGDGKNAENVAREYVDDKRDTSIFNLPKRGDLDKNSPNYSDLGTYPHPVPVIEPGNPAPGAVECEIDYMLAKDATNKDSGGRKWFTPQIIIAFRVTGTIDPLPAAPAKPTKSELMTALNAERAKIKRECKGDAMNTAIRLQALYHAFGAAQCNPKTHRRNSYPAQDRENQNMLAIIYARRKAHDITDLVIMTNVTTPTLQNVVS